MKTTAATTTTKAASPATATNASPKKRNKRKRPPTSASPLKKASPTNKIATNGRTNWALGAAKEKLEEAVREWDEQTGRAMDEVTGQRLHLKDFSTKVGIPYNTFRKYVAHQTDKRRTVGQSTGRKPLLDKEEQAQIAQELAEKGDGLLTHEAVDFVRERHPQLSKEQALRHFHRTLLKHHPEQLKVPPKRVYQPRQRSQTHKSKAAIHNEEETDDSDQDDDDDEEEEEEDSSESQRTREQALVAINAKIERLRSELLDAELEKEKLLRTK